MAGKSAWRGGLHGGKNRLTEGRQRAIALEMIDAEFVRRDGEERGIFEVGKRLARARGRG